MTEIINFTPVSGLAGGALIGLGAALLLWSNGRIAGISGIISGIRKGDLVWRLSFLAGVVFSGGMLAETAVATSPSHDSSILMLITAGLLVGAGTRLGSGCTSGHGVCGLARFSTRSLAAVCTFMLSAMVTVFVVRHLV